MPGLSDGGLERRSSVPPAIFLDILCAHASANESETGNRKLAVVLRGQTREGPALRGWILWTHAQSRDRWLHGRKIRLCNALGATKRNRPQKMYLKHTYTHIHTLSKEGSEKSNKNRSLASTFGRITFFLLVVGPKQSPRG